MTTSRRSAPMHVPRPQGRALRRTTRSRIVDRPTGAALIALVLLSLVAASIGLLVISQVTSSARDAGNRVAVDTAREIARQTIAQLRADLTSDPELAFKQVLDHELPRRCDGQTYQPGDEWPSACGSSWTYEPGPSDPSSDGVRMLLDPAGSNLRVTAVATVGPVDAGLVTDLQRVTAAEQTLWSLGDVILDDLNPSGHGTVTIDGQVYGSRVFLPSDDRVTLGAAQLLSEDGIVGNRSESPDPDLTWRYYIDSPTATHRAADPPLRNVRDIVPQRPSPAALAPAFERMAVDACPDRSAPPQPTSGGADVVCLTPGGTVVLADGSTTDLPDDLQAVAIRAADDPSTVEVVTYDRRQVAFDCTVECDLLELEQRAQTNLFTSDPDEEQILELARPASGVIGTRDVQPHLQPCGPAFLDPTAGGCAPASDTPLPTVAAGTLADPTDVFVSGPVNGAVATAGSVVVPYWARPAGDGPDGPRSLDVTLQTFALGIATGEPVRSLPQRTPEPRTSVVEDTNWGGQLTWAGTILSPAGLPSLDGWAGVRFTGQAAGTATTLPTPAAWWDVTDQRDWIPANDCPTDGEGNNAALPRRCATLR